MKEPIAINSESFNVQTTQRFWGKVNQGGLNKCWPYGGAKKNGYGIFHTGYRSYRAHRLIYAFIKGVLPGNLCVLHKCDNPLCCNPNHLFLGTQRDNIKDRDNKGHQKSLVGEFHPNSKLNNQKVREIRNLGAQGKTQRFIASEYKINQRVIWRILHGKAWTHVSN